LATNRAPARTPSHAPRTRARTGGPG